MSDTDSFIDEVTEEVRRDRLFGYFRRYGWIAAVVILGLVGGTAYNEWSKSAAAQVAQARGDALLDALDMEDDAASIAVLSAIATQEGGDVVASFLAAGSDQNQAANLLGAIAENTDQPEYIRDLARLKLVTTPDSVSQEEAVLILTDLSAAGGLYRNAATEMLVAIELERGNVDAAVTLLQAHIQDAQATQEQIQRMGELIVALGATPELAN
jgi:hypothetical protein|tara:strand:- start:384 stop:1022 length:639 start_codon:yes stop_codon:yes gene_type:complete